MIKQLSIDEMKRIFKNMKIEDRSILMGMVNDKVQTQLIDCLDIYQKNDFFFYQEFNRKEKTQNSSEQFVDQLVENFYGDNNQRIPFARIEEGYVQCIPDPKVRNGFITVQLVKPTAKTENKKV